ncbi:uncharacterized protein LOC125202042 isoform X2 [Salvia hispanica]|uniref:uncharacterized protein LOC125202042 isoform X2 n=1 Tax=Salvia hispanica TaxID=49212 RepID=UPI0020091284|nr:uncharacterized protein LOC125202042 isoform X2 [Salvia hispanica]
MFRKYPLVFSGSGHKLKNKIEFFLATGKFSVSDIVTCPVALGCSIENRLEPRLQILRLLEKRHSCHLLLYHVVYETVKVFIERKHLFWSANFVKGLEGGGIDGEAEAANTTAGGRQ